MSRTLLGAAVLFLASALLYRVLVPHRLKDISRHGVDMVGKTISIYWPNSKEWYKARVTKFNVASPHDQSLEGTHTVVYDDESVQHLMLHKIQFHVMYGTELVGHSISIYRSNLGLARIANVTVYNEHDHTHRLEFDDGGSLDLNLALEDFEVIYGFELVGKIILIAREFREDPLYASVLHYSSYKGTFVLGFADGSVETVDLKGVTFEIVHNTAADMEGQRKARYTKELNLVREVEPGHGDQAIDNTRLSLSEEAHDAQPDEPPVYRANRRTSLRREYEGDPLRGKLAEYVDRKATPGQIAIMSQAVEHFDRGLQASVKRTLDQPIKWFPCGTENNECGAIPFCAQNGSIKVRFGHIDAKFVNRTFPLKRFPIVCNELNFGRDPAVGKLKTCEVFCDQGENQIKKVSQCSETTLPFIHEVAEIPVCGGSGSEQNAGKYFKEEDVYQQAITPFCDNDIHRPGMVMQLDCAYQDAFKRFSGANAWDGTPSADHWIDRAWVTFFAGPPGGPHAGMVTNLIRSIHMFSKYPIIVFSVDTTDLSKDWRADIFPRLIVVHTNPIAYMNQRRSGISFNFNKFRSMLIRVRSAVQLDADMIMAKQCDRLFDATETHITAKYPYPIMPVHWMTRKKGADSYSNAYPVEYDDFRIRWAHAHPTWTYHALPFIADALLAKLNKEEWAEQIRRETGQPVKPIPSRFFSEDEDLLNVLLWRNNATKQWCKWDVEFALYEDYLSMNTNMPTYQDSVWYKSGIPLVFIGMHNTKDPIATDKLLGRIRREGSSDKYTFHAGTYFANPFDVEKMNDVLCLSI